MMNRTAAQRFAIIPLTFVLSTLHETKINAHEILKTEDFIAEQRAILEINKPGYLNITRDPVTNEAILLASTFQLFGKDKLISISDWRKGLAHPLSLKKSILTSETTWPNEARSAEFDLFNEQGILIAGGFLVPGKSTGAITFVPWATPLEHFNLTNPKKGWFYHRTETWDVNNDGLLDIITARAHKPMIGEHKGELLWLENPGRKNTIWQEHIIGQGPDVHFRIIPPNNNQPLTVISTEFSAKKLSAYGLHSDGSVTYALLDESLGSAFDIQIEDLNADGKKDLLVSNHEGDEKASVYGYEIDFNSMKIKARHTLITGIQTKQKAIKAASPGPITTFFPKNRENQASTKPWILVSGDGSQKAHILVPKNLNDTTSWKYNEHILWHPNSTVGQSALADVDGDGRIEIFVPAYDSNQIGVFSISPN